MAPLLPLLERDAGKLYRFRPGPDQAIEIDVPINGIPVIRPIASQQITRVVINDVVRENKRDVRLRPRPHQLVLFAKSKDVVADDVFASVMLVKAGALGAIDHVVLPDDIRAPLIRVKAPTAISD